MAAFSYILSGTNGNYLYVDGPGAGLDAVGTDLINGPLTDHLHWVSSCSPDRLLVPLKDISMAAIVTAEVERLATQYTR